jgi:hypothetical protein
MPPGAAGWNEALMMADLGAAIAVSGVSAQEVLARHARTLKKFADPDRYPALARLLDSGVMDEPDDPDFEFRFGLERVLDGVEALIRRRS